MQGQTGDEHLLVEPQGLLRKHGELLVRDAVEIDTRKVVADINQPLTNPLVVTYRPGVNQFTSRLWRVVIISESCDIRPKRNNDSLSTSSLSPSMKQSRAS